MHSLVHFGMRVRIAISVAAVVVFALMAAQAGANPDKSWNEKSALDYSQSAVGKAIRDHRLTDAQGRSVRLAQLRGKPLVVSFVYTGCHQVCPATTQFLAKAIRSAQSTLGRDSFHTLTIGFNLPFDHPVAMKTYAERNGIDLPGWLFLTPDADSLDQLLQDFGFSYTQTAGGFDHVVQVSIVDPEGRVYRQIYGDAFDLPLLVGPLKELITGVRGENGSVSDWLERVRLLCTVYDPSAGRYRLNYAVVIEILVGASVLLVGSGSLIHEWRRRRSQRS